MLHYNTTNLSALKMVHIYREMGIENNSFILQLNNPKLIDVDPLSDNLTKIEQAMIVKEIIENPWYYFREIVRIPSPGGVVRFEFHRGNIALLWALLNDISPFVLWSRQMYKSVSICAYYSHLFYWGTTYTTVSFLAHESSISKKNLRTVKDIRDELPKWLNMYDPKTDNDNVDFMFNASANNRITSRAPSRNIDSARKLGRGSTTACQFKDECAFIPFIYEIEDAISFAYSKASDAAKKANAPYHRILATTAGFLNTKEGTWAKSVLDGAADFSEKFYDMDIDEVKRIIENTSNNSYLRLEFAYYDLGRGPEYLEAQKKNLANSLNPKDTLDREVFNMWKDISTEHPLGQERIERLNNLKKDPIDTVIINSLYSMRIYKDLDKFDNFIQCIGGLDLGGNLKGDFSVLTVVDPRDFSVIAVLRANTQSTTLFSMAIAGIMTDLFPNMVLFPERNFNAAIIDNVATLVPNSSKRIYHEKPGIPGLFNSKKVRPVLFGDVLKVAIDDHGSKIHDKTIIDEISGLIRGRNGRIDHKPGKHDDTLISYLLALYFLIHIDTISNYIDPTIILSINDETKDDNMGVAYHNEKKTKRQLFNHMKELNNIDNIMGNSFNGIDDIANKFAKSMEPNNTNHTSIDIVKGDINDDISEIDSVEGIKRVINESETIDGGRYLESKPITSSDKQDFKQVFGW